MSQGARLGESLTARERDVLTALAEGCENLEIAERLGISPHTIKCHVHNVIIKLGAKNRTHAAVMYVSISCSCHKSPVGPTLYKG